GFNCSEVDECQSDDNSCSINGQCTNSPGSYQCECDEGFEGDGFNCSDVDECQSDDNNCSANAQCANTIGSYQCECNEGFEGDGFTCSEINNSTQQSSAIVDSSISSIVIEVGGELIVSNEIILSTLVSVPSGSITFKIGPNSNP